MFWLTDLEKNAHAQTHRTLRRRFQGTPEPLAPCKAPAEKLFRNPSLDGWNKAGVPMTGSGFMAGKQRYSSWWSLTLAWGPLQLFCVLHHLSGWMEQMVPWF